MRITKTVTICTAGKVTHNTLFPSSSFVIEIASPVPDETSMQAAERPARNGGHPAKPVLLLTMYIKLILILKYNVNIN